MWIRGVTWLYLSAPSAVIRLCLLRGACRASASGLRVSRWGAEMCAKITVKGGKGSRFLRPVPGSRVRPQGASASGN